MKPISGWSSLVAAAMLCGTLAAAQDAPPVDPAQPEVPAAPEAPPPSDAPTSVESPAEPAPADTATEASGTGTVVFFRPSKFVGAAIGFKVRENGQELGKLRNGKYFVLQVAPGVHQYEVQGEAKDVLTLEVEAGETYYVQGVLGAGIMAGRPNLTPSDANTFEALKPKLKEVPPLTGDDAKD
ncbi:MAG: DUF2846 domain-containing protein [Steroidobacteraceae bacterium]